ILTTTITPPTTHLYTLSLHDALPISPEVRQGPRALDDTSARGGAEGAGRLTPHGGAGLRPGADRRPLGAGRRWHVPGREPGHGRSEEHTSELQSRENLVCRLLLAKKK